MYAESEQFMSAVPQLEVETVIGRRPPPEPGIFDKLTSALPALTGIYSEAQRQKMQNKLLDMQMERARMGLPALDLTAYQPSPYAASFGVGLDNKSMLFVGILGAALLGALFLSRKGRKG